MNVADFSYLVSYRNLELAWRRVTTGLNVHYKKYFRDCYYAYEVSLKDNLRDLHARLAGGSYKPSEPIRIYIPKPSRLQRPLTLLCVEDQIVLQALANLFAKKLEQKRERLVFKFVFSNIVQEQKSGIFFFRDWHVTYQRFQKQTESIIRSGRHWIATFDLAAFYDTISHELLMRLLYPKTTESQYLERVRYWLRRWSSERESSRYSHGIPQGP